MASNKDFFDEEYDKMNESEKKPDVNPNFESWYEHPTPASEQTKSRKPWFIVLICVGLVLCIVLGWVLCAIFGGSGSLSPKEEDKYLGQILKSLRSSGLEISDEQWNAALTEVNKQVDSGKITAEAIVSSVFDTLRQDYYKDIPEEKWYAAVESAGTSLLQAAGDQFCRLMSPQSYYDYLNPQSDISLNGGAVFGFSYQHIGGLGMYISSVMANSPSYGLLKEEDLVYRLSNVKDKNGAPLKLFVDNVETDLSEIVVGDWETESFQNLMSYVNSATFCIIRNGHAIEDGIDITRGKVTYVNAAYPFEFVEFYFGDDCTNLSTKAIADLPEGVKTERRLSELSKLPDTGYVRISQFSETDTVNGKTSADEEFQKVMKLFQDRHLKRLILDLKGNPGGSVDIVCNIASYLVTDSKLTQQQQADLNSKDGWLITKLTTRNAEENMLYQRKSKYSSYFGVASNVCDIVVWTDGGSASASELLTGALRDYKTALQMGTTTYGKGIAQTITPLEYTGTVKTVNGGTAEEHWAVYYTVAEYFSPLGDNIHGVGYTPDKQYDGLDTYEKLWQSTLSYWSSSGGGMLV